MEDLAKTAAGLGLPFRAREKIYNSRPAQELGLWAESLNGDNSFHKTVFKAYFAEGMEISKVSVLVELAESIGLSGAEARDVLESGSFSSAVDKDWSLARENNITAVPTFIFNQERLVGAQPYQKLKNLLEKHGTGKRQ